MTNKMTLALMAAVLLLSLEVQPRAQSSDGEPPAVRGLARGIIPQERVTNIVSAVNGLRDGLAQPLLDLLSGPAGWEELVAIGRSPTTASA